MHYDSEGRRLPSVTRKGIYGFFGEYRWLSNFHLCKVTIQGIKYPSSEHAYMAMKTLNQSQRRLISKMPRPQDARNYGRNVLTLRQDWDSIRLEKMYKVLRCKFIQNIELRSLLLKTGKLYLEETNDWHDTFYGVCNGMGENNLGKLLMQIREELS